MGFPSAQPNALPSGRPSLRPTTSPASPTTKPTTLATLALTFSPTSSPNSGESFISTSPTATSQPTNDNLLPENNVLGSGKMSIATQSVIGAVVCAWLCFLIVYISTRFQKKSRRVAVVL